MLYFWIKIEDNLIHSCVKSVFSISDKSSWYIHQLDIETQSFDYDTLTPLVTIQSMGLLTKHAKPTIATTWKSKLYKNQKFPYEKGFYKQKLWDFSLIWYLVWIVGPEVLLGFYDSNCENKYFCEKSEKRSQG